MEENRCTVILKKHTCYIFAWVGISRGWTREDWPDTVDALSVLSLSPHFPLTLYLSWVSDFDEVPPELYYQFLLTARQLLSLSMWPTSSEQVTCHFSLSRNAKWGNARMKGSPEQCASITQGGMENPWDCFPFYMDWEDLCSDLLDLSLVWADTGWVLSLFNTDGCCIIPARPCGDLNICIRNS